ncbi:MAG TPA: LysE family translocator [Sphingomicrobium sp.]|jgi:threonine/homoserine/homoserine lactone efflux protein|nr:LysE family translocator [Sphingomicrobium sp.]
MRRHGVVMIAPEKLAAFALMSAAASIVPGPSMLFVMGQSIWRSGRSGAAALAGVQFGYVWWWVLAALGLGTLALTFPIGFRALALAGALYLGWLGFRAVRNAGNSEGVVRTRKPSGHAFRDGVFVAMSNPKSLIYIVALLPPFVDARSPVVPQLVLLAVVAMAIDVVLGAAYILAGNGLARAITERSTRIWLDRAVGVIFIAIALAIFADLLLG